MLHVYGPGGVGKTMLLGEFGRVASAAGLPAVRLDGRSVEPSPTGFLFALRQAIGLGDESLPAAVFGEQRRGVRC